MSIINDKSGSMMHNISCAKQVLDLIFPLYTVTFSPDAILLVDANDKFTLCG
jgi:hypothetical protein